ncbi:MAG: 50S ribosomal protein L11 methyltransferase [Anaerolineae bacterium]
MEWLEVSVDVNREAAEAVAEVLSRYAPQGVAFDLGENPEVSAHVTVKAYLAVDEAIAAKRRKIEESLGHLHHIWSVIPEPSFRILPDQDWTTTWKEELPILHLGRRVVIKPSWRDYTPRPQEVVLEMDPGMAFGTGLHPTTQLCVDALEDLAEPGMRVLDLGTGTGILAMIAAKLGLGPILAVDNDENAIVAARRNVRANQLAGQIELRHGTLAEVEGAYDLILANILASVIIDMAQAGLVQHLRPGGILVASGILEEQTEGVVQALTAHGLPVIEKRQQGEWVALIARSA